MTALLRHRGLKALNWGRTVRRLVLEHVGRLRDTLATLDSSRRPEGMNPPGFGYTHLRDRERGSTQFRYPETGAVAFQSEDGAPVDVDYVDYH